MPEHGQPRWNTAQRVALVLAIVLGLTFTAPVLLPQDRHRCEGPAVIEAITGAHGPSILTTCRERSREKVIRAVILVALVAAGATAALKVLDD